MSLTKKQKARLKLADETIAQKDTVQQAKSGSQQPRFDAVDSSLFVGLTTRWAKEIFENPPPYDNDSRKRGEWLNKFWRQEPYLSGVINSVVQIDRNRGWSLVGGRNQVLRFQQVLHNWQVQPGNSSWRDGVGAASLAFNTTDIGALIEVGRTMQGGPLAGFFHLDPTRCWLKSNPEEPLWYFPANVGRLGSRHVAFTPEDYLHVNSMTSIDETFNGLGYCSLSRCLDLAVILTALWRHEEEMLFARAPKGLLLLKGITMDTWKDAMTIRDAEQESKQQQWFGAVAVLANAGEADVDAKLVALSQLPEGFDQQTFTDLMIYGYANAFGYDAREFWPVSQGSLGTGRESDIQHHKATGKGGKEFWLGLQEQIQNQLPPTLHFEPEERDADAEKADAALALAQVQVVTAMYETGMQKTTGDGLIDKPQAMELLAEKGIIPRDWTAAAGESEGSDTGETDESTAQAKLVKQRVLEYPEVQQAIIKYPKEPIVRYIYPANKIQVLFQSGEEVIQKFYQASAPGEEPGRPLTKQSRYSKNPIARLLQKLSKEAKDG